MGSLCRPAGASQEQGSGSFQQMTDKRHRDRQARGFRGAVSPITTLSRTWLSSHQSTSRLGSSAVNEQGAIVKLVKIMFSSSDVVAPLTAVTLVVLACHIVRRRCFEDRTILFHAARFSFLTRVLSKPVLRNNLQAAVRHASISPRVCPSHARIQPSLFCCVSPG